VSGRGGGSRRRARELALQTLYAIDLGLRRSGRPELPLHSVDLDASAGEVEETLIAAERAADAGPHDGPATEDALAVFDGIAENFEAPPAARKLAWELVSAVCGHAALLDERIAARALNWRVSRMAAVDRNILRLATYELGHTTVPKAVVIDQAVELARRYGSDTSPAFVNGILDALAGDLRPGAASGARRAAGDAS
jgi:N utilization substance protein B